MNYQFLFLLHSISTIFLLVRRSNCILTTESPNPKAIDNVTHNDIEESESGVKISKLDPEDTLGKHYALCSYKGEEFLKTLDDVKEKCAEHHGMIVKGMLYSDYLKSVTHDSVEALDMFESHSETETQDSSDKKPKSRKQRFKRDKDFIKGDYECVGCVAADKSRVLFADLVKIKNEAKEEDCNGLPCPTREKPNVPLDIVLAAVVSFLFCALLLWIFSCRPIFSGSYIPLKYFTCARTQNVLKVRFRNHTLDANDFSIVDFDE